MLRFLALFALLGGCVAQGADYGDSPCGSDPSVPFYSVECAARSAAWTTCQDALVCGALPDYAAALQCRDAAAASYCDDHDCSASYGSNQWDQLSECELTQERAACGFAGIAEPCQL